MSWRQQSRYRLLTDRIASLTGDHSTPIEDARALASTAAERGDLRYQYRAQLFAATIDARSGRHLDIETVGQLVKSFLPLCGPDGWRDLGELAAATRSDIIWRQAELRAARVVAEASGRSELDARAVARAVRLQIDRLRP
jgi:hypothetical protein